MKIQTKYHGEIEIAPSDVITFSSGIPGFESEKEFVLLSFPDNPAFYALQSVSTPSVGFVVADPFSFFIDYKVKIDDATIEALSIEGEEDVILLSILTVRDPFQETTANLQAPVVINKKTQAGRQLILTGKPYETRHNLFQTKEA
ncbi:flagellar assembly protein FliW [Domibacillus sp. DTU_2020_1001157_1_SI_ALB_TIR_016]|uniref:flagellar assembly protein FliW n=1 Tax=Domibacillus sp. DTU_2020_1001157_1_SI_ALB_TIR_016 TaxID=3077789 RepID=UPI0028F17431|nr:flagellar assembly protein FliW [Domibacillus sp. DTU_2020_1001157_1_SI_ALB_TIR_016]WNS81300.1 flagellar assembly protein FliW [Domibacillus sp. DTU_2020_1001157_1_SI_ALB_TIR_016]